MMVAKSRWKSTHSGWKTPFQTENRNRTNKKSLLIELKRSNRRDFLLCEIIGMIAEIVSNQYHFAVLN